MIKPLYLHADDDAILIFGAAVSEDMEDEIAITVIATGFSEGLERESMEYKPIRRPEPKAESRAGFRFII